MKLSIAFDDLCSDHQAPGGHPERPERLRAAKAGVAASRWASTATTLAPRDATAEELERVHSKEHVARIGSLAGKSGYLDRDTYYSSGTAAAVVRASGGALALVDSLLVGDSDFAFGSFRPPGHHATQDQAMGFCLVNHIAVAAAHARSKGVQRVMILDFDVHHGNGTEEIFYSDPKTLYASVHESPQYPGTGLVTDFGKAEGRGFTLNVPLSAGAGDAAMIECFRRIFCPVIRSFAPELLLVSAGYDAHELDPLGGMQVTDRGYGQLTRLMLSSLPEGGRGRTLLLLEGGYDLAALEGGICATLNALGPSSFDANSSPLEFNAAPATNELSAAHRQQIERAVKAHSEFWPLELGELS